jgi:hypothetical protein
MPLVVQLELALLSHPDNLLQLNSNGCTTVTEIGNVYHDIIQ